MNRQVTLTTGDTRITGHSNRMRNYIFQEVIALYSQNYIF